MIGSNKHAPIDVDSLEMILSSASLQCAPGQTHRHNQDTAPLPDRSEKDIRPRLDRDGNLKRPRNCFIIFRCDLLARHGCKLPQNVFSNYAAETWSRMRPYQKQPWIEEAARERAIVKAIALRYRIPFSQRLPKKRGECMFHNE